MMVPDCIKRLSTAYEDLKTKLAVKYFNCNKQFKFIVGVFIEFLF